MQIKLPKKDKKTGKQMVSYSQLSTWEDKPRDYIRRYFFTEKFTGNDYTDFGTKIGEALESGDFSSFSKKEQKLLNTIPRYDDFERRIEWHFKDFFVLGFIDTSTKDGLNIIDYKTGDIEKVRPKYDSDDYRQLHIYAGAIEQETGNLPKSAKVIIISREGNAFKKEELTLGDSMDEVIKNITPESISEVKDKVLKTVEEISEYYKVFLKLP